MADICLSSIKAGKGQKFPDRIERFHHLRGSELPTAQNTQVDGLSGLQQDPFAQPLKAALKGLLVKPLAG